MGSPMISTRHADPKAKHPTWVPHESNAPHPTLKTIPARQNDTVVRQQLEAYVGQTLDPTLDYNSVLWDYI